MSRKAGHGPLLLADGRSRFLVMPGQGMKHIRGLGVVDTDTLGEAEPGSVRDIAGREFRVLRADILDILAGIRRGPQWVMPKDAAQIVLGCGIGPGSRVLEAGTGTGALTIVLAHIVGPGGSVVTYESNPRHAALARGNIELSGLGGIIKLRESDLASHPADEREFHAVVLDLPDPWDHLGVVAPALAVGGRICCYLPTVNQLERTMLALMDAGFGDTHAVENLQREMKVGPGATRPAFDMLGHTGYLCFGRKTAP